MCIWSCRWSGMWDGFSQRWGANPPDLTANPGSLPVSLGGQAAAWYSDRFPYRGEGGVCPNGPKLVKQHGLADLIFHP